MKAVWIDAGNDPDYGKLAEYGITRAYFPLNAGEITANYLADVHSHGLDVGVYAAWNWSTFEPDQFAEWVNGRLLQIGSPLNPWVCLDIETHDVLWILRALQRYRQLRPTRPTSWTLEPMQGGLFDAAAVRLINAANVDIVPQHYGGSMQPFAADRVALDLAIRGFALTRIKGFYDAARLPGLLEWDGLAFTQGWLP